MIRLQDLCPYEKFDIKCDLLENTIEGVIDIAEGATLLVTKSVALVKNIKASAH